MKGTNNIHSFKYKTEIALEWSFKNNVGHFVKNGCQGGVVVKSANVSGVRLFSHISNIHTTKTNARCNAIIERKGFGVILLYTLTPFTLQIRVYTEELLVFNYDIVCTRKYVV